MKQTDRQTGKQTDRQTEKRGGGDRVGERGRDTMTDFVRRLDGSRTVIAQQS